MSIANCYIFSKLYVERCCMFKVTDVIENNFDHKRSYNREQDCLALTIARMFKVINRATVDYLQDKHSF